MSNGDNFAEYRRLIMAQQESMERRLDQVEESIVGLKVQMGVLVVKIGLLVAGFALVGAPVATYVFNRMVG